MALIVASLANVFLQMPALTVTVSAVAVLIFSLYLLHDLTNIVRGGASDGRGVGGLVTASRAKDGEPCR